jgi:hypothetical protein
MPPGDDTRVARCPVLWIEEPREAADTVFVDQISRPGHQPRSICTTLRKPSGKTDRPHDFVDDVVVRGGGGDQRFGGGQRCRIIGSNVDHRLDEQALAQVRTGACRSFRR